MATFNEMMQCYVDLPYEQLLSLAKLNLSKIHGDMLRVFGDNKNTATATLVIIAACLGADSHLSELEHQFLNDLLGASQSYEATESLMQSWGGDRSREVANRLADSLEGDKKAALISFCICFLAVDESITRDEANFVNMLLA